MYPELTRDNFARPAERPMRRLNPAVGGVGYRNTDFLYDSFSVAQAAAFPAKTPMFQTAVSASKTLAQTNMRTSGLLANGEVFRLRRIRVLIAGNTFGADALNILQNCSLTLSMGGRPFIAGPLHAFPGGGGLNITAIANTGAPEAAATLRYGVSNGIPEIHNAFTFEDPIDLNNSEQIQVDIVAETAFNMTATAAGGLGTTVYVFLDGKRTRPVS